MSQALLLSARFHDDWYHGERGHGINEWPPAPARLFQALVAGAARGDELSDEDRTALEWLESCEAPMIAAPLARKAQPFTNFVPNNDLDKFGGDHREINQIRTVKTIRPCIFNSETPLLFRWAFHNEHEEHARTICQIAERLYQLGRGVDMAWAWAEILDADETEMLLTRDERVVYCPNKDGVDKTLLCPVKGSLSSLMQRYAANSKRFNLIKQGRQTQQSFSKPPEPRFAKVMYNAPARHVLFELRTLDNTHTFAAWSLARTVELVKFIRDGACKLLKDELPAETQKIDRVFIGCKATEADKTTRLRIVPLPSIGHHHADYGIRRVLIETPANCPLRTDDISWAFSGLEQYNEETGEIHWNLVKTEEDSMLQHYGIDSGEQNKYRVWRTVTPAALPIPHTRKRKDDPAPNRRTIEEQACHAAKQALRHAGITTPIDTIRVQHEPFEHNGSRAGEFAVSSRFTKRNLFHVEIAFIQPLCGPLIIGNGRYFGLGLMAPIKGVSSDVLFFSIKCPKDIAVTDSPALLRAVRRALMSLSRDEDGDKPRLLFSGHESGGRAAHSGRHDHVFLAADDTNDDGCLDRLIIVAPWACDHTRKTNDNEREHFDNVARKLALVRAGRLGMIKLEQGYAPATEKTIIGPARIWESQTPYRPTRHAGRRKDEYASVSYDIIAEFKRRGLPEPEIEISELHAGPKGGNVSARLRLHFTIAVKGPLMLGRDSHSGGGLFTAITDHPFD